MQPIGIFDSGFGGLTVMRSIVDRLPEYDYLYLGDNARAPYGTRSFDTVYRYTWECVQWFFSNGCPLVILACNTASAKALRNIQQNELPKLPEQRKVLGVIRPSTEILGSMTSSGEVGILATPGTVNSDSYPIELARFSPGVKVYQEACPMWVPLVENNEIDSEGSRFFINKNLRSLMAKGQNIDTILLACTHYPLLIQTIRSLADPQTRIVAQGELVAESLASYLKRHSEVETKCTRGGTRRFFTTDSPGEFEQKGSLFFGEPLRAEQAIL